MLLFSYRYVADKVTFLLVGWFDPTFNTGIHANQRMMADGFGDLVVKLSSKKIHLDFVDPLISPPVPP